MERGPCGYSPQFLKLNSLTLKKLHTPTLESKDSRNYNQMSHSLDWILDHFGVITASFHFTQEPLCEHENRICSRYMEEACHRYFSCLRGILVCWLITREYSPARSELELRVKFILRRIQTSALNEKVFLVICGMIFHNHATHYGLYRALNDMLS